VLKWSGRIGHVLLCAVVLAPFGALGLFLVALAPVFTRKFNFLAGWWWLLVLLRALTKGGTPMPPVTDKYTDNQLRDWEGSRWENGQVILAALVTLAALIGCYFLDGWTGVLICGAVLGALIGATLSILSQLPAGK
jgi:hypothetical protein